MWMLNSLVHLSSGQLRRAANLKEKIESLEGELASLMGGSVGVRRVGRPPKDSNSTPAPTTKKRKMSAAGRARIAAAQKARWAKVKSEKGK
jgi:hypothetical protein